MISSSKEGLNRLLVDMIQNENRYIPNHELKQLHIELRMMRQKYIIQCMAQTTRKLDLILILIEI